LPASALAFVLLAAFMHALWNVLLARARDVQAATAVAVLVGLLAFAPVAAVVWRVQAAAWPFVVASGFLHLTYYTLLAAAYRRAELSVVYPLARGAAPVLVLLVSVGILGSSTSSAQVVGVLLVALGILLVRGLGGKGQRTGVAFGLVIACTIAAYTLVDKHGVAHANPIAYLELVTILPTLSLAGRTVLRRGLPVLRAQVLPTVVVAGLATFGAYALVLAALARAPAAPVAAVRETSVVIAAVLARTVLRERVGRARFAGAALVAVGIAVLSL
jgi:drug/metabolite transporter (DMT)-like permease